MIEVAIRIPQEKTVINAGKTYEYTDAVFTHTKQWTHKQDKNPNSWHPFNIITEEIYD